MQITNEAMPLLGQSIKLLNRHWGVPTIDHSLHEGDQEHKPTLRHTLGVSNRLYTSMCPPSSAITLGNAMHWQLVGCM